LDEPERIQMNALKIIILALSLLVLTTQAARHIYVRYIEPRISVLDKFEETDATKVIQSAKSLSEIVAQYELARRRTDELDKVLKSQLSVLTRDEYFMIEQKFKEDHSDEYKREAELKEAIEEWESRSKEILELRVFWSFGFGFFLFGVILLSRGNNWMGLSLIIPGIVEMIWWTSPSFRFAGSALEFDRLLNNKLVFTIITLILLVLAWTFDKLKTNKDIQHAPPAGRGEAPRP